MDSPTASASPVEGSALGSSLATPTPQETSVASTDEVTNGGVEHKSWTGWAELENDPAIFRTLLREWGVPSIQVNEVIPLDSIFDYPAESIYGLIFLSRWVEQEEENETTEAPSGVWFANQTLSNSCATVALMNIINNHPTLNLGPALNEFRSETLDNTPKDRGLALDRFDFVRDVHNSFATEIDRMNVDLRLKQDMDLAKKKEKQAAKTKRPQKKRKVEESDYEDESGLHFVAYVPVEGIVWRMDGLESFPRRIGIVEDGQGWIAMVVPELQALLEKAEGYAAEYSLLSLTAMDDFSNVEREQEKMKRMREDWGPFIAQMVKIHADRGDLKQMLG